MELPEFKNAFFGPLRIYNTLTSYEKNKYRFMIQRTLVSKFPELANYMNKLDMSGSSVADAWKALFMKHSLPSIGYNKTKKADKTTKAWYPKDSEIFELYRSKYSISIRDFEERLKWKPIETKKEFTKFEKNFK